MAIDTPERPQRPENNTGTGSLSPTLERQLQDILQTATPAKEGVAVPPSQATPRKGNPLLMPSPARRVVLPASKSTLPPLEAFRKAPLADSPAIQPAVPSKARSPSPVFSTPNYWKLLWKTIKYSIHARFSMSKEDLRRREAQRKAVRREKHAPNDAASDTSSGLGRYGIKFDTNKRYSDIEKAFDEQELAEIQRQMQAYNRTHPKLSEDEIRRLKAERDGIDKALGIGAALVEIAEIDNKKLRPGEAKWRAVRVLETVVIYRRQPDDLTEREECRKFKYAGYMVIRSRPVTNEEIRDYQETLGIRRESLHHDYVFVGRYLELRNGNEQLPSEAIVLKKGQSYIPTRKDSILPGDVFGQPLFTHTTATRGDYERVLKSPLLTKYEPDKVEEAKKIFREELDTVIYTSLC